MYLMKAKHLVGPHLCLQLALFHRNRHVINKFDSRNVRQFSLNSAHCVTFQSCSHRRSKGTLNPNLFAVYGCFHLPDGIKSPAHQPNAFRQLRRSDRFEERTHAEIYAKPFSNARKYLRTDQRVSSEFEEVVFWMDIHSEQFRP